MRKNFNNMSLHTLVIDFLKENNRKLNIFFYFHVLYTEIFTLKAYYSAKKQQMTEIFQDVNQGTRYYRFMKKTRAWKSHPFNIVQRIAHGNNHYPIWSFSYPIFFHCQLLRLGASKIRYPIADRRTILHRRRKPTQNYSLKSWWDRPFKGSVSRKLRPRLLYIIRKLSLSKQCPATIFTKFYWRDTPQFTFKKLGV